MTAEGNDVSELREAIVGALLQFDISPHDAPEMADAVLALPELAALRAKADAADRVREALDALSRETGAYEAGYKGWAQTVIRNIRRALDGDDRTGRPPALEWVTCADLLTPCTHQGPHVPVGLDGRPDDRTDRGRC